MCIIYPEALKRVGPARNVNRFAVTRSIIILSRTNQSVSFLSSRRGLWRFRCEDMCLGLGNHCACIYCYVRMKHFSVYSMLTSKLQPFSPLSNQDAYEETKWLPLVFYIMVNVNYVDKEWFCTRYLRVSLIIGLATRSSWFNSTRCWSTRGRLKKMTAIL